MVMQVSDTGLASRSVDGNRRRLVRTILPAWLPLALAACAPSLGRLERTLAANDSATAALGQWCSARGIAAPAAIRAVADRGAAEAPSAAIRAALDIGAEEPVAFRQVRLMCGSAVLSEAKNWYVPARLTPAMNAALLSTDTPFGTVVRPLGFRRERLESRRGRAAECPAGTVLSHKAALRLADGRGISLVIECYTPANLRKPESQ
jgi:chorismate-pyruvate lyase